MGMTRTYRTLDGGEITTADAKYFMNLEVERTCQHLQNTLFLVGKDDPENIVAHAKEQNIEHVYFGTGTSFLPADRDDVQAWDEMILSVLDAGLWATLDFDSDLLDTVASMKINQHEKFIPMISVKAGGWERINSNAVVKLDDVDFDCANSGVWCVGLDTLVKDCYKTEWAEYTEDTLIESE